MSVSGVSARRPVAVAMLFLAVGLLGLISFIRLPIDLLPDVSYPRLVVYTSYPDVAPAEVERFVTEPVEATVSSVPGVVRIESVSREGTSLVTLRFAWGTDMDFAVLNVREKLDNLRDQLPELSERPVVLRTDPTSEPVMAVSVAGERDIAETKELAEEVFKRRLEQIDGIAQAAISGGLEREIHVEVDPRKLESYGLTMEELATALDQANRSAPGGTIRRGRFRYALRTVGEFENLTEIAEVPLRRDLPDGDAGSMLRLGDVATVREGFKDRESLARFDGAESVGLLLFKEGGANTVEVSERVSEVLAQLEVEYPEVRIEVASSQAGFIQDAISSVVQALVMGGVLAFLVLFLFLRDVRYPVGVALAIPISVIGTFSLLDLLDVSLNIMSLGGLALGVGMLVDNSIVVLENIFRHREAGATGVVAATRGAEEVQGAITASTLTTISVFGPIIYVEGVAGQLFKALSLAVASALMVSLIVALTLLPTLAARWGGEPEELPTWRQRSTRWVQDLLRRSLGRVTQPVLSAFDRGFDRFAVRYHRLLERSLDRRGLVVAVSGVLLLVGLSAGWTLRREVLPEVDQGAFQVNLTLSRGTSIETTEETVTRLEEGIRRSPAVAAIFSRVGRQFTLGGVEDEESGLHTARLDVRLEPDARTADVLSEIGGVFETLAAGSWSLETGQATALGRLLGGEDADLAVRIRGDDLSAAMAYAELIETRLSDMPELRNVRLSSEAGQPEILVRVDREKAAAYGVDPARIAEAVERHMRGSEATDFIEFDQKVPIVVRLPEAERRSMSTLEEIRVDGVPLRELVQVQETVGPSEIRRLDQSRTVSVFADVASGGLDAALSSISLTLGELELPRGLQVALGGENEERRRSFRELAFAFGLALLLVYMILAAQFESFIHPFTILLSVPLATVGASLALWWSGGGLNTMSLIGMVILVGIVVNDAIVKVDFINQIRAAGHGLREAILEAGRVRLRPILMTTVTTVLGLTPMALGLGRGADLRAPLAVAVIGGLLSSTALTLIVVPVAYDLMEEVRVRVRSALGMGRGTPAPVEGHS